jgi:glycosyltransferase involved in cell wall biosynthesis
MALGKPVIATDSGGAKEIEENGETGFTIGDRDIDRLVEKIQYILDRQDVCARFGNAGKNRILKQFSIDTMTDAYYDLYRSLIGIVK